jgi:hypothetical protein
MTFKSWTVEQYWNAATNTPKLVSGRGENGKGYIVSVPGTTTLDGNSTWAANDIVIFILDQWVKVSAGVAVAPSTGGAAEMTLTEAKAATVGPNPPETLRTTGFYVPGDRGEGLYKHITNLPAAPLTNTGTFTTGDGFNYIKVVEAHGRVHVNGFGAKTLASTTDTSFDSYAAFGDCRDFIISQNAAHTDAGPSLTMVLSGPYYLSKAFITGSDTYDIEGSGGREASSRITTPWPYDQIISSHNGGFGREGEVYTSAFTVYLGQRASVGNHIYVAVTPGTPSGSTPPSGTGLGQVDGSVVWNYEREKVYHELATGGFDGTIRNITCASNWSAFTPHSHNTEATKPSDDQTNLATEGAFFSGFLMRNRAKLENVACFGQAGMGISFCAGGDAFHRGGGNVDDWRIDHAHVGFLAWNGFHFGVMNANAGILTDGDTVDCGAFGTSNRGFLDNKFIGMQADGDGQFFRGFSKYPTSCTHRGYHYLARLYLAGVENIPLYLNEEPGAAPVSSRFPWIRFEGDGTFNFSTITASLSGGVLNVTAHAGSNLNVGTILYDGGVTPGTKITGLGTGTGGNGTYTVTGTQVLASTTIHADTFDDANYAPWDPAQRYMPGGMYGNDNINNSSLVAGQYQEQGTWPPQYAPKDIVIGSALSYLENTRGGTVLQFGQWQTAVRQATKFTSNAGVKIRQVQLGAAPIDGGIPGAIADSPLLFITDYDGTVYEFGSSMENQLATRGDRTANNDFDFGLPNGLKWLMLAGKNTLRDYGRGVPFPMAGHIPNLLVGDGGTEARRVFVVESVPTGGPFTVGDMAIPKHPVVGQPKAWTCTAAPDTTHSTWTSWGNL